MELSEWRQRRKDPKTEKYWNKLESEKELNSFEKYQKEWNFIETEYSERPSNNGLDIANTGFAFTTNLAKYITA